MDNILDGVLNSYNNTKIESLSKKYSNKNNINNTVEKFKLNNGKVKSIYKTPADAKRKLRESSEDLVSFMVNDMMKAMRKTLNNKDDMFYGGFSQDVFTEMLDSEYSKALVKNTRMPLVDKIYQQLSRNIKDNTNNINITK